MQANHTALAFLALLSVELIFLFCAGLSYEKSFSKIWLYVALYFSFAYSSFLYAATLEDFLVGSLEAVWLSL